VFLVVGFLADNSAVDEINLPRRIIDGLHSGRRQGSDDFFQVSDVFLFGIFQCDTLRSDILDGLKVLLCLGVFHCLRCVLVLSVICLGVKHGNAEEHNSR